jgi:magnesium-transporting ATPase (P-type)
MRPRLPAWTVDALESARPPAARGELPFDSERKRMSTLHARPTKASSSASRARPKSSWRAAPGGWTAAGPAPFDADGALRARPSAWPRKGLRVLAFARAPA